MAIVIPSSQIEISHNTCKVLCNKILHAMSRNGVSSLEYSGIVLQPEVTYSNSNMSEGGIRTIHTYDIQLNIAARNLISGTEFGNVVLPLRGSGTKPDDAVLQAVNTLKENDRTIDAFISDAKRKIIDYYESNTSSLINKAQNLATMQRYDEALALLETYPVSLSGYQQVSKVMLDIYKKYQDDVCGQIMQQAQSEYAAGDYGSAVVMLQQIDMHSSCAAEAKKLCRQIKLSREVEAARQAEAYERAAAREASIKKARIKAIRDVAVQYYKSLDKYYYIMW